MPNVKICRTSTKARTAASGELPLTGRVNLTFEACGKQHVVSFYVSESIDVPVLLGIDFLRTVPCVIDLQQKRLTMAPSESIRSVSAEVTSVGRVVVGRDHVLAPGSETIIQGYAHNCEYKGAAIAEPSAELQGIEVIRSIVHVDSSSVPVLVRNVTADHITIPKHSSLADLEISFVEEPVSHSSNKEGAGAPDVCADTENSSEQSKSVDFAGLVNLTDSSLTEEERETLFSVLRKYEPMFDGHIGHTDLITHRIDTGDHSPIRHSPRRIPPNLQEEVRGQLDDLVRQGILEESDGTWSSPISVVKKKSGAWRVVADLRKINSVTKIPAYPIPRIDDALEALSGSKYFCVLDMNSAYYQISIDPADREKASITTPFGNRRFKRMCFGLATAPYTCAKLLNIVLGDLTPHVCVSYFDDITVHSNSKEELMERLDAVLSRLSAAGLTLNLAKCQFFQERVNFLGHVVSQEGIAADPEKVRKVVEWPEPRTAKELSSFLGLASYFRKFIKGFAQLAAPLFHLTNKDVTFQWSQEHAVSFDALKSALSNAPIVTFPRFGPEAGSFILDCDASNEATGCVLLQVQDGVEKVVAYGSRRLSKSQRNYSTTKKELLACVTFVQDFSHYLLGKKFTIRTDHSSLQWLLNFRNPTGMLARWLEILGNFNFDIVYRPGVVHTAADGLSRRPEETVDVGCQTDFESQDVSGQQCYRVEAEDWPLSYIQGEQHGDEVIAEVSRLLAAGQKPRRGTASAMVRPWIRQWNRLRLLKGVLFRVFKRRPHDSERLQVVVPSSLVPGVLSSMHSGPSGGHFSREKLLAQLQLRYYWPTMAADVEQFCKACDRCQGRNDPAQKPRAPMGELRATEPWETVSIDFLTDLPLTANGNKHLLVCCDHFTRWVEVFPLPDMKATTVAEVLTRELFSRFGCPKSLHSDRAANFKSELISELCRLMGVKKTFTTSFYPQGNGKCERVNRTILNMLSRYLSDNHAEWDLHLPLLMLGYRSQVHKSLGYSPFFLTFGREARLPVESEFDVPRNFRSRSVAEYIDELCNGLRKAYKEAIRMSDLSNTRNKNLYDRKLNSFTYNPGDPVMLFRNVARRGEYYKFVRPWKSAVIVSQVGDLNYRVRTEDGKMLMVHHNRLKPRQSLPQHLDRSDPPVGDDARNEVSEKGDGDGPGESGESSPQEQVTSRPAESQVVSGEPTEDADGRDDLIIFAAGPLQRYLQLGTAQSSLQEPPMNQGPTVEEAPSSRYPQRNRVPPDRFCPCDCD